MAGAAALSLPAVWWSAPGTAHAQSAPASVPGTAGPGYWLAGADGGVYSFAAPFYGSGYSTQPSACTFSPEPPSTANPALGCVSIASAPAGSGYWLLNGYRSAFGYGTPAHTPQACTSLNGAQGRWVGMAAASEQSYWVVASNGGVMSCASGSMPTPPVYGVLASTDLVAPIVGMVATIDRQGYWLVSADGGVFSFGDAAFYGSTGGIKLDKPVVGITATADGKGYWLAASDDGVFAFGDAAFYGSTGGTALDKPVVGIAATPDGKGYWLAASDGGVFAFGDAPFNGSMAGHTLAGPIVGIAAGS